MNLLSFRKFEILIQTLNFKAFRGNNFSLIESSFYLRWWADKIVTHANSKHSDLIEVTESIETEVASLFVYVWYANPGRLKLYFQHGYPNSMENRAADSTGHNLRVLIVTA